MSEAAINRNNTYPGANMGTTRVRTIPATLQRHTAKPLTATLRVAAYARVSTDEEEQQTSYEAQVDYYTKKIKERPEWIFVSVYTDATVIIGLKQNPTIGRRFSPIFSIFGHFSSKTDKCYI